ncbi:actin cross-linking [Cryptococcus wingfieldii CBS 7118]|uniref:Actin cross-linking n=1 Tax=Cryptococcus wingfieldii CBS 7118 TaxID=1295528 RepID=A0A1E3IKP3_9TREE|nr:actin cross-linking [Cryptococcus wingfieldii CBS 7118]ODN89162.1 actin cross-linking [Cryptococcus wingfieldii CBS 7118]
MAFARFGASKYRNAAPAIPPPATWYRGDLPPLTPSAPTTFTSEIKTTREYIITVAPTGELSLRGYAGQAASIKVGSGGGVGDWDVSRLEDALLAVGGLDGAVSVYVLPAPPSTTQPSLLYSIPPSSSPVTNIAFHPTTPGILLISTITQPAAIYDLHSNPKEPKIILNAREPKGLWTIAWKNDGRLIAAVGRSGTAYTWNPRSSPSPSFSKPLQIQSLKPARLAWVGEDIFLTSFSKMRVRQYSLLSGSDLGTKFEQGVDTNQGTLVPLVDEQRKIIFLAGRGDMTLRQIELSGAQGFQESIHPLPFPISSSSLAGVHAGELEVMQAEIARVLVKGEDKDGVVLLPVGVRVPRRQLIDFHQDLYPDIPGSIAEQSSEEWFKGDDKLPLPISVNPARRGMWEKQVGQAAQSRQRTSAPPSAVNSDVTRVAEDESDSPAAAEEAVEAKEAPITTPSTTLSTKPTEEDKPRKDIASTTTVSGSEETKTPTPPTETKQSTEEENTVTSPVGSPDALAPKAEEPPKQPARTNAPATPTPEEPLPSPTPTPTAKTALPPLQEGETHSSTSYKVRIIGDFLADQVVEWKKGEKGKGPLMVGLQGPQGCGKTTLTGALVDYLSDEKELVGAVLSTDDLYKNHAGLKAVAAKHPTNALLSGRGPPGTHDLDLAERTLSAATKLNDSPGAYVHLPIFDKSKYGGEGDRSPKTRKVVGPVDVFILEGWSMGFAPLGEEELEKAYKDPKAASPKTSRVFFPDYPLESLKTLNEYLQPFASVLYPFFSSFIQIEPLSYDYVFQWRLEQEHGMKAQNGGKGMGDEEVREFVGRYMPGYELWAGGVWRKGKGWEGEGTGLRMRFGEGREVVEVGKPGEGYVDHSPSAPVEDGKVVEKVSKPSPERAGSVPAAPTKRPEAATSKDSPANPKLTATQPPTNPSTDRFNPSWSRKYLAAKSPLIPSYDSLPPLSSLHQDSHVLRLTPHLAFFPIQGTGGRLCVQPLKKKGRVAVGGEGYLSGGVEIVDFDAELGEGRRVAVAGEDGKVRVWRVGEEGVKGVGPEPGQVLHGKSIDKFTQILFHPTAKDLLVGVTNDRGVANIRFRDLSKGEEVKQVEVPAPAVYRLAFSPSGDRVAIGSKDGRLLVFDPRDTSTVVSGKAHDSPRSFQISWIDEEHIVTVGFSRGSLRKILLYRLPTTPGEEITTISSLTIDTSPSVLFPVYDPDTSILYVWGKGERVIQAYEINPSNEREPVAKLPGFTADNPQVGVVWLPKRMVDLKKVEVGKALRLTAKALEEVSFTIPRNKPEFFQDDIYVPTTDIEATPLTAEEWLSGKSAERPTINLHPAKMTPLSQAPKADTSTKKKFVPAANVMSEEEKKKNEMDRLFAKAKMDESSDEEEEEEESKGLDPPDDDW